MYSARGAIILSQVNFQRSQVVLRSEPFRHVDMTTMNGGILGYSMNAGGDVTMVDVSRNFDPCQWNSNWLLNMVSHALCEGEDEVVACDLVYNLYPTLEQMVAGNHGEKYSVRGFMSKFAKICSKLTYR